MTEKDRKKTLKLMESVLKEFPKVLAKKKMAFEEKKKRLKAFAPLAESLHKQSKMVVEGGAPVHPWRLCPLGQFYRKTHKQKSYVRSNGVQVRGSIHPNECVINKTGKDQLYAEEIQEIAARNFGTLTHLPTANVLTQFKNEAEFDSLIAGWTQYWNEVLKPNDLLDPDLVKALIASESGFNPNASNKKRGLKRARGLMQVTDESIIFLSNRGKDLKDHFVNLKEDDTLDPNLDICAGIRWLFRKREIAEAKDPDVSWMNVIMKYKSYSSLDDREMKRIASLYGSLKNKTKN